MIKKEPLMKSEYISMIYLNLPQHQSVKML